MPAGSVCDDLVDFSDFLPTLVEFAGAEPEPGAVLDGRSFLPQLQGEPGTPREWLYCYYNPRPGKADWPEVRYVQDARFKLYGDGRLYDLVDDPLEEAGDDPQGKQDRGRRARDGRGLVHASIPFQLSLSRSESSPRLRPPRSRAPRGEPSAGGSGVYQRCPDPYRARTSCSPQGRACPRGCWVVRAHEVGCMQ